MKRGLALGLLLIVLITCFPGTARAGQNPSKGTKVVHEGQKVEAVFLFSEDGIISGEVTGEVVVINGNLHLTRTASIRGSVFLFGGKLTQEPGAKVCEEIYHINLGRGSQNSLLLGVLAFVAVEFGKFALAILIILGSMVSWLIFRTGVNRAKVALLEQFAKTGLLGLFAALGLVLIIIALSVTIWGIPLAILLSIVIAALLPIGLGALSLTMGELLLRSFAWGHKPHIEVLAGSLFIVAFLNFPVFGILWGGLVLVFAVGALTLSVLPWRADSGV